MIALLFLIDLCEEKKTEIVEDSCHLSIWHQTLTTNLIE